MNAARKWVLFGTTVWGMAITLLRAARLPNDYAEAHWLLDYRFGFVKRGLIGAAFSAFSGLTHIPQTETSIAVLSTVALAAFCAALLSAVYRVAERLDWEGDSVLFANVFVTSPFVVMSAHLIGYFDNIVLLLGLAAVLLVLHDRPWLAAVFQVTAVLVQEIYVLIGLPCVALASWLAFTAKRRGRTSVRMASWLRLALPLVPPVLAFAALTVFQASSTDRDHLRTLLTMRLSSFDFIQSNRNVLAPRWLLTSLPEFLHSQRGFLLARLTNRTLIVAVVPSLCALLYFAFKTFKVKLASIESSLIACVVLAPLVMNVIAWDTARIWTYPIFCAFCVTWTLAEAVASQRPDERSWFRFIAFPTIVLNVLVTIPLMDNEVERLTGPERWILYAPVLLGSLAAIAPFPPSRQRCETSR